MKNQFNKISRLKIAMAVTLWPVAMLTVGSLQRDFFAERGVLCRTAKKGF